MENGRGVWATIESILKHPQRVMYELHQPRPGILIVSLLAISAVCLLVYGLIVGTFSGGEQLLMAPLKIVLGMFASALICLPSLFIFACLSGREFRILEVCGLLFAGMALSAVLLIGFAPVAWIFSTSTNSIVFMGFLHLVIWGIGTCFGLQLLFRAMEHNTMSGSSHLRVWGFIFILVMLQMTTTLRPIIGTASTILPKEKKFFLAHWGDCMEKK
jgi:hypothetical protein